MYVLNLVSCKSMFMSEGGNRCDQSNVEKKPSRNPSHNYLKIREGAVRTWLVRFDSFLLMEVE